MKVKIVGISFKDNDNIIYFDSCQYDLKRNITVIVETERGYQLGKVEIPSFESKTISKKRKLDKVIRIASKKDFQTHLKNKKDAEEALITCRNLVEKYKLNMNIINAEYVLDRNQLFFNFTADGRVDFRNLAKELASKYKTRIELYQLGVRDKAKEIGGCGLCGRKLCCSRFKNDFTSVSINMAKNQNLSLNPTKINGVCGRLLCCLRYEDDQYKECRKIMPQIGKMVDTKEGKGKVVSLDIINQKYTVQIQEKGQVEVVVENGSC